MKKEIPNFNVQLLSDLKSLYESKRFSDIAIQVKNEIIKAHKTILCARSTYFASLFEKAMPDKPIDIIQIEDYTFETINEMIRFLYCGEVVDLEKIVYELIIAADKV